jgi:hypothetical protein
LKKDDEKMAILEQDQPIFDEKVQSILRSLAQGKTREDIALSEGNKNWKSVDMYMRRRHFQWDSNKQTYVPKLPKRSEWNPADASKAGQITSLLAKDGADLRMVAGRLGFKDHIELAAYMNTKGYAWIDGLNNYVKQTGVKPTASNESLASEDDLIVAITGDEKVVTALVPTDALQHYLPILDLLSKNKERLIDLIVPGSQVGIIPRYVVPGIATTKTIHMMNTIVQLVLDFSREKNITQREVIEVALIEFFKKYGYEQEIERLLGS